MAKKKEITVKGFTRTAHTRGDRAFVGSECSYAYVEIDVDQIPVEVTLTDADILVIGDRYLELAAKRNKANATKKPEVTDDE